MHPKLLNTEALADYIGVSPHTLERWRINGGGPAFLKAGRRVLYCSKDINTWLSNSRHLSTSEPQSTINEIGVQNEH